MVHTLCVGAMSEGAQEEEGMEEESEGMEEESEGMEEEGKEVGRGWRESGWRDGKSSKGVALAGME